jgi:hypothetical protein
MIRRRRPTREIPFSFDSFLDIVANVVGIIIRLILVVWVGARSYHTLQHRLHAAPPATAAAELHEIQDPLAQEIARRRRELDDAQRQLLEQLRQLGSVREAQHHEEEQLAVLDSRRRGLEQQKAGLEKAAGQRAEAVRASAPPLNELRERSRRLTEEIQALQKLPPPKTLRYRTPVSRPVQSDEIMFECHHGRVTLIDIGALLAEVRRGMEAKVTLLHSQWQVDDVAGPVGAFRLRYTVERERGVLDPLGGAAPDARTTFRYGISRWEVEPVALVRGETLEAAFADGSEFRQVSDGIDAQTVVTMWVYPDSFELYRRLRDYLYDRDVVVAGRPLPEGVPIASSRHGTVSRGQ